MKAAVRENGKALLFASEDLWKNMNIVMTAVKKRGWALCNVFSALRGDEDIFLEAVRVSGSVLELSSVKIRGDCYAVLEAAGQNKIHYNKQIGQGLPGKIQKPQPSFVNFFHALSQ